MKEFNIESISVIDNIKQNYDELFSAERKVADYILNNMEEVPMLNVSELASKSDTSDATVVRTIKHLGYSGYYQMRILLSRDIAKYNVTYEKKDLSTSKQIFDYHAERVEYLSENIDTATLLNVSKILLESNNNHIIGVGNTIPVVLDLGFRLERYGVRCTYSMLPEHFYNHIMLGDERDSVIAISRTGASKQVIRAAEIARKKGMKLVVITGELNKQLVSGADEIIRIVEKNNNEGMVIKPDSHLLEIAVNDAILYSVKNYEELSAVKIDKQTTKDNVDVLLSEFKL